MNTYLSNMMYTADQVYRNITISAGSLTTVTLTDLPLVSNYRRSISAWSIANSSTNGANSSYINIYNIAYNTNGTAVYLRNLSNLDAKFDLYLTLTYMSTQVLQGSSSSSYTIPS
jgi:hypothetical protein